MVTTYVIACLIQMLVDGRTGKRTDTCTKINVLNTHSTIYLESVRQPSFDLAGLHQLLRVVHAPSQFSLYQNHYSWFIQKFYKIE